MLQLLYKYLVLNKQVSIPGMGRFYLERQPATHDFANRMFVAPLEQIIFQDEVVNTDKKLHTFIAREQQIEEASVEKHLNEFKEALTSQLHTNGKVQILPFGVLTKSSSGKFLFEANKQITSFFPSVPAERRIVEVSKEQQNVAATKQKATQLVEEKRSSEYSHTKKDYWWVAAIIIAVIAIAAIGYYYYQNGSFR